MFKKIFFIFFIIIDITAIAGCIFLTYISSKTDTAPLYFPRLFYTVKHNPTLSPGFNFLILGLDPRNDSLEKTETTDTIIFANLSTDYKINLMSLPRDLWDYSLNSKINQIYPLSIGQTNHFEYIQSQYQLLLDQKIDRTIVITTQNLIDLVRLVGGVDIYLKNGFKDEQYPNPAYIASPSAKISKYKTVEFSQGYIHLNETNVTEFVRSRKSAETAELGGTDIGRIERQQILINALLVKIKNIFNYRQFQYVFNLYKFFHSDIQTNFTDNDIMSIFLQSYHQIDQITLNIISLTTGENPKTDLLFHPRTFINLQWVYLPQDKDYSRFQQFIKKSLNK